MAPRRIKRFSKVGASFSTYESSPRTYFDYRDVSYVFELIIHENALLTQKIMLNR